MAQDTLKKIGKCINKTFCTNADSGKEIKIPFGDEFVCPECGLDLVEIPVAEPKFSKWAKIVISIGVVLGLAVGGYFLFFDKPLPASDSKIIDTKIILNNGKTTDSTEIIPEGTNKKNGNTRGASSGSNKTTIRDSSYGRPIGDSYAPVRNPVDSVPESDNPQ